MNEPLLQNKEESKSDAPKLGLGGAQAPSQQSSRAMAMFERLQAAYAKKQRQNNIIQELVKLPVTMGDGYLEKCAKGIKYDLPEPEPKQIWYDENDTERKKRLEDPKEILEGLRVKENAMEGVDENMIVPGQVAECEGRIFIGCKDQVIRCFSGFKHGFEGGSISQVGQQNKQLVQMQAEKNFLVTLNLEKQLYVYEIGSVSSVEKFTLQNVFGFELKSDLTLYYNQEGTFYQTSLTANEPQQLQIETPFNSSKFYFNFNENQLLAATIEGAVWLLSINGSKKEILMESQPNLFVKALHYSEQVVTIVTYDNGQGITTLKVIDLSKEIIPDEDDEAEKLKAKKKSKSMAVAELPISEVKNYENTVRTWELGECHGVTFSKTLYARNDAGLQSERWMLISTATQIFVLEGKLWETIHFQVKCDFGVARSVFSSNEKYIYSVGYDSSVRTLDFLNQIDEYDTLDMNIADAATSNDNRFYALLSEDQSKVTVYLYRDYTQIADYSSKTPIFHISFTADSNALVVLSSSDKDCEFVVTIIVPFKRYDNETFRITLPDGYTSQVDASRKRRELYVIGKSPASSTLYIFNFKGDLIFDQIDTKSLALSTDEKLLATTNTSKQIKMLLLDQVPLEDKTTTKGTPKVADAPPKPDNQQSLIKADAPVVTKQVVKISPPVINTIELTDNAVKIAFFGNNFKIAALTGNNIFGFDIYTHEILFKVQAVGSNYPFSKIQVIFDLYIAFQDPAGRLVILDSSYELDNDFIQLSTLPLKSIELKVNDQKVSHMAWSTIGYHIIVQDCDKKAQLQRSPFLHHNFQGNVVSHDLFRNLKGYFLPILSGGPKLGTGSFSSIYNQAIQGESVDATSLRTPIYPYRLNALHYFAITANVEGAEQCFKNKVKFMLDSFGKSPLDYAIESHDRLIIDTVMNGLFNTEAVERSRIMRTLPLSVLLEHPSGVLGVLLQQGGVEEPLPTEFGQPLTIPTLFPNKKLMFGRSGIPSYSAEVAEQLHPPRCVKPNKIFLPVTTQVLNNPVPEDFSEDSLNLLKNIADCGDDSILRSKPITLYLNRKWNKYAYKFYFSQFFLFTLLLVSLAGLGIFNESHIAKIFYLTGFVTATYFTLWELMQLAIQGGEYFQSPANIIDVARLILIYLNLFSVIIPDFGAQLPYELLPISFCLIWHKMLNYLLVFKPTRYLIKMIFEIIYDIKTFLIILFSSLLAYAQISFVLDANTEAVDDGFITQLKNSYVLSLGELGDFGEFSALRFIVFIIFSFLIPLVLMNMLIALMSDSYSRVQTNAVAADAKALAEMEAEMEEVVSFLANKFKPDMIKQGFYYFFVTQCNDGEEDGDWEGMVGQLKATIDEKTQELESNLTNKISEMQKTNTEKIVDNILRTNKAELDVMDKVEKLVKTETANLQDQLEQKMIEEANLINNRFESTQEELREKFTQNFQKIEETTNNQMQLLQNTKQELHTNLTTAISQTQEHLHKTFTSESEQIRTNFNTNLNKVATDLDTKNTQLQGEMQKAQSLVQNVGQNLDQAQKSIIENVDQKSSNTQKDIKGATDSQQKAFFEENKKTLETFNDMIVNNVYKKLEALQANTERQLADLEVQKQKMMEVFTNFDNLRNIFVQEHQNIQQSVVKLHTNQERQEQFNKKQEDEQKNMVVLIGQLQNISSTAVTMMEEQKVALTQSTGGQIKEIHNQLTKILQENNLFKDSITHLKEDFDKEKQTRIQVDEKQGKLLEDCNSKLQNEISEIAKTFHEVQEIKKKIEELSQKRSKKDKDSSSSDDEKKDDKKEESKKGGKKGKQ